MFKNILSKVGWGDLPSSFGYTIGEKVELPFKSIWSFHKGTKKQDGSAVSVFVCNKKEASMKDVAAGQNAVMLAKMLRHPNVLRALDSADVDSGLYLVTEAVVPLLSLEAPEDGQDDPAVWGLYQALDALNFLHSTGYSHGYFEPISIFVTQEGEYRLGGFELSCKDTDASALLMGRRNVLMGIDGWPEPPRTLGESNTPSMALDLWGASVVIAYVFQSASTRRRGSEFRLNLAGAQEDLPQGLRKTFERLQSPGRPAKDAVSRFLQGQYFQQMPAVQVMLFFGNLHIKTAEEREQFFEQLPPIVDQIPKTLQKKQLLRDLLAAVQLNMKEAAQVLPAVLKIGARLTDEEFKAKVQPLVVQLFALQDRAVRFRLLTSIGDMIDLLDEAFINDKIFPDIVNGFTDSNAAIREATVKSLVHFVPRLKKQTVEKRVVAIMAKLLTDPEPSIRTNSVICYGKLAQYFPQAQLGQILGNAFTQGLKDPFAPCRSATLHTMKATASVFSPEEMAGRLLPGVCQRLVDPDPSVSQVAFDVLQAQTVELRQIVADRRATQQEAAPPGAPGAAAASTQDTTQSATSGWGSWALSSASSAGFSLMGKMSAGMTKKDDSSQGPEQPPPNAPPPPAAGSSPAPQHNPAGAPSRGMSLGSSSAGGTSTASGKTSSSALEKAGWDDDADTGAAWGDEEDNFWDEFKDEPKVAAPKAKANSTPAPFTPAARPAPSSNNEPALSPTKGMSLSKPKAAPAAPAPKATPAPKAAATALKVDDDEDFWSQFNE